MKKLLLAAAALSALLLTGCASPLMNPVENAPTAIPKDKAVITFFRSNFVAKHTHAPLAQETADGGLKFLGMVSDGTKIRTEVEPGDYTFVVGGYTGKLLKAKVDANKAYYVRVETQQIPYSALFSLEAVKPAQLSDEFLQNLIKEAKLVEPNQKANDWFVKKHQLMERCLTAGKKRYDAETAEEKTVNTLTPEDGIHVLY
jgi:outer membrane murein-binding lipoprotein Lpp